MYEILVDNQSMGTTQDRSYAHEYALMEALRIQIREGRYVEWEVKEITL